MPDNEFADHQKIHGVMKESRTRQVMRHPVKLVRGLLTSDLEMKPRVILIRIIVIEMEAVHHAPIPPSLNSLFNCGRVEMGIIPERHLVAPHAHSDRLSLKWYTVLWLTDVCKYID